MEAKYYAVRNGRRPGVYTSWDACRREIEGFSGAAYKSFETMAQAQAYVNGRDAAEAIPEESTLLEIYVDGSYRADTQTFSYGMVILEGGQQRCFSEQFSDPDLAAMRNVAGEIRGAEAAMRYAALNGAQVLILYHDYEGIAKWCTGEWKARRAGTAAYKAAYDSLKGQLDIRFSKVRGHSHNTYNDLADRLAKNVLGIQNPRKKEAET